MLRSTLHKVILVLYLKLFFSLYDSEHYLFTNHKLKMTKHYLLIVIAMLLIYVPTNAQNNKYDGNYNVLLKSGTEQFEANLNDFIQNPLLTSTETVNGYFYRFLQFKTLPDTETLQKIKQSGVILFDYVPHKTYIAGIPTTLEYTKMKKWGVRSITKMTSLQKLSKNALGPVYPNWAENGDKIQLIVSYFRNISEAKAQELFNAAGVNVIEMQPNSQTAIIEVKKSNIGSIANFDFIYFLETIPEPPMPEDRLGRTFHRSNVINTMIPSGKHYDGTGVSILTRDDGEIGPHIDFQNRVIQNAEPAADGTHGDGVAGIMGGAGNLDPTIQGMAPGSMMYVVDYVSNFSNDNTLQLHQNDNVVITNSSYSDGCNGGYTTNARVVDEQTYLNPSLLHVFSAGNSNSQDCGYGAGNQWGNITGGHKIGKNVIATANLFADGSLVASSSRGPSEDGRLKPDISANGQDQLSISTDNTYQSFGGTSGAAPGIAGVATQLYDAYRQMNGGQDPEAGFIKAILLNGAEDFGNPGPDFKYGWGRVNAYRSLEILENNDYLVGTIMNNGSNTHTITVPANVKQVKVMTYWNEPAASVNAAVVLTNDLDMTMTTPSGEMFLPWILDYTPNPTALDTDATRGVDNVNNVEQVTLDNPAAGTYTITVNAPVVTNGSTDYYVVTTFIYDEITVVYPLGGEGLIPGTMERIHWDAFGNQSSFLIEFTTDNGANWYSIANVTGDERMFDWTIPNIVTGQAQVRISRGSNLGQSQADFSILGRPDNIQLTKVCPNMIRIEWDSLAGAAAYDVFILGFQYMDSVGTTTDNFFEIPIINPIQTHWVAVRGAGTNGLRGRRTIAERFDVTALINCAFANDVAVSNLSPNGYITDCASSSFEVTTEITNNSTTPQSNFPISYDYNGTVITETFTGSIPSGSTTPYTFTTGLGTLSAGSYALTAWTSLPNEDYTGNDTLSSAFDISVGTVTILPAVEDFDTLATCGMTTNCGATICPLGNGWVNLTNGQDDDIDWRVNSGTTTSAGTGPTADHTGNNGNYIYLEASNGCEEQEATLLSPCVDLTTAIAPQLSFWYHGNGTNVGELHVDVYNGTEWMNDVMPPMTGSQGNNWIQGFVNLQPYTGNLVNIRFRGTTGNGWSSDMALDDINISEVTVAPTANFTVSQFGGCVGDIIELIDQSGNIPTTWNWTISPNTFSYVNGTDSTTRNPLVTFNAVGFYDIQLNITNPNGTDSTIQYGIVNISNGGTIPYVEDFEGNAFPPIGINIENPDNNQTWQLGNATGSDGNPTQAPFVSNVNYNAQGEEDNMVLSIDLTNETAASMSFDVAHARYSGTYSDGLRIDVYTNCGGTLAGTVFAKSGDDLATVPDQIGAYTPGAAADWRNEAVDLTNYVGSVVKIKFVNECDYGNNLYVDNINIIDSSITTPGGGGTDVFAVAFTSSQGNFCVGQNVSVFDNSTGDGLTYAWDFGIDATPQTATVAGPHNFNYSSSGQKTIKLIVTDANGIVDSLTSNVFIQGLPLAIFNLVQQNDSTIKVFNGATFSNTTVWDFGDGTTSTVQNPVHVYDSTGIFTVTLTASGICGSDAQTQTVTTQLVNTEDVLKVADNISVFPNPSNGQYTVSIEGLTKDLTLKIVDVQGRVLRQWQYDNPTTNFIQNIDISDVAEGIYFLQVQTADGLDVVRLIKQ
ncbi:MAG: PKD repeat protein [Saprospiraceae bacterium]